MQKLWRKTSRHRLVFAFSVLAVVLYFTPLQRYVTLGRYQHYGIAIGIFGLGYLLQTIWSWKEFTRWARWAYLSTAIFSLNVGLTFFYNPWLDTKVAQPSHANDQMRPALMALYLLSSLYVGAVYARWIKEENQARLGAADSKVAAGSVESSSQQGV